MLFWFTFAAELVENDDNGYEYEDIGNITFMSLLRHSRHIKFSISHNQPEITILYLLSMYVNMMVLF